jgi:hypothetical protein
MTDATIKPMIFIDRAATEKQMKNLEPLLDVCPKCGTKTETGFGLAGGGYGCYVYCPTKGCDYFAKFQVEI